MGDIQHLYGNYYKPLQLEPDAEDLALHKEYCSPAMITRRLRQLVPLLEFTGCYVETVGPEETVLVVPLLPSAVNQNGTQQASIFYLLADYTLGVAMFGVLPGVYVMGVCDRGKALPVQYWLRSGSVKHLAPGTGTMRAVARVSAEEATTLRRGLVEGGRCELEGTVSIYQGDQLVAIAEHKMGMYADLPRRPGTGVNPSQMINLKVSALMIAGLRGDPLSQQLAGEQGKVVASRMSQVAPQLPTLVKSRSVSVTRHLETDGANHEQVVCLGVGLDPKPAQLATAERVWFGVDLPEMILERRQHFAAVGATNEHFREVSADLRVAGWVDRLNDVGFDPEKRTTVILEGLSMYLSAPELAGLLTEVRLLMKHADSRLWFDHVTDDLFRMTQPEVVEFLFAMSRLGEPFILGFKQADGVIGDKWEVLNCESAADVLGIKEPVHEQYRFSTMRLNDGSRA